MSYSTDNINQSKSLDRLILLLEDSIPLLKNQISEKDGAIDYFLKELSKKHDRTLHNKISNINAKTISIQIK